MTKPISWDTNRLTLGELFFCLLDYVVLGDSCRQSKHTAAHVLQKMPTASFA